MLDEHGFDKKVMRKTKANFNNQIYCKKKNHNDISLLSIYQQFHLRQFPTGEFRSWMQ